MKAINELTATGDELTGINIIKRALEEPEDKLLPTPVWKVQCSRKVRESNGPAWIRCQKVAMVTW